MNPMRPALVAVLAACSAACTSSSPDEAAGSFPAAPLMTMMSTSGTLRVAVRSEPTQPPELAVVPWMPAMGHGTSTVPQVTEQGDGVYHVDEVVLFMPGQWDLRTAISGADKDDLVVSVDIP
jgi:hypothetical protein